MKESTIACRWYEDTPRLLWFVSFLILSVAMFWLIKPESALAVNQSGQPTVVVSTTQALYLTIVGGNNSSTIQFAIFNTTTANYITATGAATTTPVYQTSSTWAGPVSIINLATNTAYQFITIARDPGAGNELAASSTASTAVYTRATPAGTPTVSAASSSTLTVVIDAATNPAGTTYAIFNTTTGNYLDSTGAATGTPVFQTTSTWTSSFVAASLTPNTQYQFVVRSRNGDSVSAATSSANTAVYTNAAVPTALAITVTSDTALSVAWDDTDNPSSTTYRLYNVTTGAAVGTTTSTSYAVTGLTAGTYYTFYVQAQNLSDNSTYSSASVSASRATSGGTSSGSSGGGGNYSIFLRSPQQTTSPAPAPTPMPTPQPTPAPAPTPMPTPQPTSMPSIARTLVKYAGDSRVYVIENGMKRHIASEAAFNSHGYRWSDIETIPNTEVYPNGASVEPIATANPVFTLYLVRGTSGGEVRLLQEVLQRLGYFPATVTPNGVFGPVTHAAVVQFQRANSLPAYGIIGPLTRAILNQM